MQHVRLLTPEREWPKMAELIGWHHDDPRLAELPYLGED